MNTALITQVFHTARRDGRDVLLETEGLQFLTALGLPAPGHVFVGSAADVSEVALGRLAGTRVAIKVVSPQILHKSDIGGVAIVDKTLRQVASTIADMHARLGGRGVVGYTISEFVPHATGLGNEFLVGLRWTDDAGPVVTIGAGGIYTEFLADHFKVGRDVAVLSPDLSTPDTVRHALEQVAVVQLATRALRGQPARLALDAIIGVVQVFLELGRTLGDQIAECEVNPFVLASDGRLTALDVLVTLRDPDQRLGTAAPPRPLAKLKYLLEPRSAAIMGVSERLNPGHIIVNNLIREGFDRDRIFIIKPGSERLEGCRCVPDIRSLPERVDMFVICIDAAQASGALVEIVERQAAESVVLIPGGLEEKAGSDAIVRRMRDALAQARQSAWGGPVINGGNCLGIRSMPGRYDTTFIPEYKLPVPTGAPSRLAIVSQSGAFAVARASKLATLNPKYAITLGNQMDLTVGDYLTYLKDDDGIDVFAVYVEGFRPLDGLRFLKAARAITDSGRTVVLYRAGRTPAGAKASASHTASIAGDYAVIRALGREAGVIVADSLEDFDDLTQMFTLLGASRPKGWNLAAVSNAGFECVAIADSLGSFQLPPYGPATERAFGEIFAKSRIDQVVDVHNPIDLTPIIGDTAYAEVVEAALDDERFDAAVIGCVPMTGALNSLPGGEGHREDFHRPDSFVSRLAGMRGRNGKPWIAVVDAGALYDAMARHLVAAGIPTFRAADRAMRLFNVYCASRMRGSL
ncbi:MAG: acetate--CoA ligase family protein [Acidobacteria bacterium]|nr:acetate--CoA ligase family protein [Acidobacteriota bacterium]